MGRQNRIQKVLVMEYEAEMVDSTETIWMARKRKRYEEEEEEEA